MVDTGSMILFHSPAPQWREPFPTAGFAARLVPVLEDGFWGVEENADPDGAFVDDVSGIAGLDDTVTTGLKLAQTPSGVTGLYT